MLDVERQALGPAYPAAGWLFVWENGQRPRPDTVTGTFNGTVAQREGVVRHARCVRCIRHFRPILPPPSAFTGFRFPREVIVLAVRWYLRYGLSYRDVEELLAERGVQVDHVTIYRWVQRFTRC
jgi:hypothetical protein